MIGKKTGDFPIRNTENKVDGHVDDVRRWKDLPFLLGCKFSVGCNLVKREFGDRSSFVLGIEAELSNSSSDPPLTRLLKAQDAIGDARVLKMSCKLSNALVLWIKENSAKIWDSKQI